jgi:hypothetical protein
MLNGGGWEHYFLRIENSDGTFTVTEPAKTTTSRGGSYESPDNAVAGFHTHWSNNPPEPKSPFDKDDEWARDHKRPEYVITKDWVYRICPDGKITRFPRSSLAPGDYEGYNPGLPYP